MASRLSADSKVGAPNVAPVDDTGHQRLAGQFRHRGHRGIRSVDQVDADRLDRGPGQRGQRGTGVPEVGGDKDRGPLGHRPQRRVDPLRQRERVGGNVGHQHRLVELDPVRPGRGQQAQQFGVERDQLVEAVDRCARTAHRLAQQQEGDRADDRRAGGNTQFQGFFELTDHLGRVQAEPGVRPDLGNDVVVVGVEPLGHLQRGDLIGAPRGGEVAVQLVGDTGYPVRQRAEQHRGVQHLVVVGERIDRHRVQAGVGQRRPGVAAQRGGHVLQVALGDPAGPVAFGGTFEFAIGADTRRAGNGGSKRLSGHKVVLHSRVWSPPADAQPSRSRCACRHNTCNRDGHTPIPRGDEPPGAARPAQLAGLRTHRRVSGWIPLLAVASQSFDQCC
ncbi:hypothetical protein C1Y40_01004 [Mycobacterium talmoniae]|uniref:Uncharacterized protein n=1 Tax=Mycobacterium talmoniae TaxID=1858794 RepID=A0A2S8BQ18_9MYCO|nr:hypothetical protein C1Y40_01004 [Mycobacterium talmoniae]